MRSFALLVPWLLLAPALAATRADAAPPSAPPRKEVAAASRVVIVEADTDDALVREAAMRLRAELGAAGFEVVSLPRAPSGGEVRAGLERAAEEAGAFAAATISRSRKGATADLWIVDRVTRKTVVRTVEVAGAAAPSVMAVRAVELLQASLLEASLLEARAQPAGAEGTGDVAVPEDVRRWMAPARRQAGLSPPPQRAGMLAGIGVEAGIAALASAGGIGPAFGPALRLSYGGGATGDGGWLPAGLAVRLSFAGPMLAPALEGALGTVSVRQEMALLDAVWAPEVGAPISPVFSAGVGAAHLVIRGDPLPPLRSATGEVWSLAAALGAGAGARVTERAALLLDAHVIVAEPGAVVTLGGERVGSAWRPTFAGSLGLLVQL